MSGKKAKSYTLQAGLPSYKGGKLDIPTYHTLPSGSSMAPTDPNIDSEAGSPMKKSKKTPQQKADEVFEETIQDAIKDAERNILRKVLQNVVLHRVREAINAKYTGQLPDSEIDEFAKSGARGVRHELYQIEMLPTSLHGVNLMTAIAKTPNDDANFED